MSTFTVTIDRFVADTKEKVEAVWKQSLQDTFEQILDPWPVDTGFSRASFVVSSTSWTAVTNARPDPNGSYPPSDEYVVAIAGSSLGDTLYGNFTANYAVYIEYGANGRPGRGLVRQAAMAWPQTVASNVQRLKNG